jgi:hypothetical protein
MNQNYAPEKPQWKRRERILGIQSAIDEACGILNPMSLSETLSIKEMYEQQFKPAYEKGDTVEIGRLVFNNPDLMKLLESREQDVAKASGLSYFITRMTEVKIKELKGDTK